MPGYVLRTPVFTSLGMISLLPLAMAIEVAKDPTNHKLFPFEIVLYWIPAFLVAFIPALVGMKFRNAIERS